MSAASVRYCVILTRSATVKPASLSASPTLPPGLRGLVVEVGRDRPVGCESGGSGNRQPLGAGSDLDGVAVGADMCSDSDVADGVHVASRLAAFRPGDPSISQRWPGARRPAVSGLRTG